MGSRWTRALTGGLAISMSALAAPAHGADYVSVENVTAAAQVYISDCPDGVPLQIGDVCIDTDVLFFQARIKGMTGPPPPWTLFIVEYTGVVGEDGLELVSLRSGPLPRMDTSTRSTCSQRPPVGRFR